MSRVIKFRKWDFEEREMIAGDNLAFEEYAPLVHLLSQEGIMQWTGLKDRNGVDIYEGDIVKGKTDIFERLTGEVSYAGSRYVVDGVKKYTGIREELNGFYEVIGNKWEPNHET